MKSTPEPTPNPSMKRTLIPTTDQCTLCPDGHELQDPNMTILIITPKTRYDEFRTRQDVEHVYHLRFKKQHLMVSFFATFHG